MKRLVAMAAAAALLFSTVAAFADPLGSAVGGSAGNQSSLSGGLYQSSPSVLTNGQQAAFAIDPVTHAIMTVPASGGIATTVNQGAPNAAGAQSWPVQGAGASAAPVSGNPLLIGGSDGTNARTIKTDTNGNEITVGNVAAGSADSGAPVKAGGKYNVTLPTLADGNRGDLQLNPSGALIVAGTASIPGTGQAITGNTFQDATGTSRPLAALLYLSNGTSSNVAKSTVGAALVNTGVGVTAVEEAGRTYSHISTSTTTTVKSGAGFLHTINVNALGTVASTVTIYDNTAGSGTVIAVLNTLTIGQGSYTYDIAFSTGLTLVTTGTVAPDITVSYR